MLLKKRPPAIDHLPPELLSLVFKYSIPDLDNPGEWMQKLSGVSRIWQDVILNTPTLWNTIIVAEDVGLANLQIQLKRFRQTLLHISIRGWKGYFPLSGDLFRELLEATLPTMDRWNTLFIEIRSSTRKQLFTNSDIYNFLLSQRSIMFHHRIPWILKIRPSNNSFR